MKMVADVESPQGSEADARAEKSASHRDGDDVPIRFARVVKNRLEAGKER
ncbi:MAG: hypothetical protein H7A52_02200 [Akkermansiaceae bacterium]|nr:hypothetical protein [Akkermansiaceae bacterium]